MAKALSAEIKTPWNHGFAKTANIVKQLVGRDFKTKYRRSIFGVLWSVLNPLFMMIIQTLVFSYFFRANVEHYSLYLIVGNITFAFMSEATSAGMSSIIDNAALLKKVKITRAVFPTEKTLFAFVNFAISLIAVGIVFLIQQVPINANALWVLPFFVYMLLFNMGLAFILCTVAVFFRDMMHLWGVITTAWMYLTPIFWSLEISPDFMRNIIYWNPLYQYITYFRDCLIYGKTPTLEQNLICIAFSLVVLLAGVVVFKRHEDKFILYI